MEIISKIKEMKQKTEQWHAADCSVGLVPTMGYLHEGHMSLVRRSVEDNDRTVVSIFVNPMQFGLNEDLDEYPRDLESDIEISAKNKVDVIFAPSVKEMYPHGFNSAVDVRGVSENMAGKSRPGHFLGVCTVVNKLFNITDPDKAYFGQKDAQQLAVIRKMVIDLNMNPAIVGCETIREKDGLAMSSRNSYLNDKDRSKAVNIYKALRIGNEVFNKGHSDSVVIKNSISDYLGRIPSLTMDYIEIADADSMIPCDTVSEGNLCLISVKVGNTTLIDNIRFNRFNK